MNKYSLRFSKYEENKEDIFLKHQKQSEKILMVSAAISVLFMIFVLFFLFNQ